MVFFIAQLFFFVFFFSGASIPLVPESKKIESESNGTAPLPTPPKEVRPYQGINPPWSLKRLGEVWAHSHAGRKPTSNYDDGQTQIFDHKENGGTLGWRAPSCLTRKEPFKKGICPINIH